MHSKNEMNKHKTLHDTRTNLWLKIKEYKTMQLVYFGQRPALDLQRSWFGKTQKGPLRFVSLDKYYPDVERPSFIYGKDGNRESRIQIILVYYIIILVQRYNICKIGRECNFSKFRDSLILCGCFIFINSW